MDLHLAFVATYPPRRCGIATFTRDLRGAVGGGEVAVLHPPDQPDLYPLEVRQRIRREVARDYRSAAQAMREAGVDVVSLQHEYGIYGGPDGAHALELAAALRRLDIPTVATLHTILARPTASQRRILQELARQASGVVVMSGSAAELLTERYGVARGAVRVIPHGVPDFPRGRPEAAKQELGLGGRHVVLSFGLIGPGKGYELAVEAMVPVAARHPEARYVILGATHPELLRREGEAYRERLQARIRALALEEHVHLVDRYVGTPELARWLQAADVFLTPYPNLEQIVSGTLSYALGAGKAIVSTPYTYAREALAEGRGLLVPPAAPHALSGALARLLADPDRRAELGARAYAFGRRMIWPQVGAAYREAFAAAVATGDRRARRDTAQPEALHA